MDDDQPRITILGAGPIGLEAALYARYLGYPVQILERGPVPAPQVLSRAEEAVGSFKELASRLGVAALLAQNTGWQSPNSARVLTATEWHRHYLLPLAETDLIADVLQFDTEVVSLERSHDQIDESFQILCRNGSSAELAYAAEILIDATGSEGERAWFPADDASEELTFLNPEADCYILGHKSCRAGPFTFAAGLTQIRELFAILGEREDLDVYATMPPID